MPHPLPQHGLEPAPPRRRAFRGLWLATLGPAEAPATELRRWLQTACGRSLLLEVEPGAPAPDTVAAGGTAVVFDGVLHDRRELAAELGVEPDASDARLVLEAYRRWRIGAVERLRGRFAFVLWDGRAERLLCARDPLGKHPLFYRETADRVILSSTTDAFGALDGGGLEPDPAVLAGLLARHYPELERTFYRGVKRVPPGHLLLREGGAVRIRRHWRPAPIGAGAEWVREDELPRFGELLDRAVGRALEDGPAGIFLSGGLDSVSVSAAAAEHARERGTPLPHALSLLFPGEVSEEPIQRGVASRLGLELTTLPLEEALGHDGLVGAGLRLSATSAMPLQNVWTPAYHELVEIAKRHGCGTILTGGGGDEWLTVTPLYAADLLRKGDLAGVVRLVGAMRRSLNLPRRALWRNVALTHGLRPLLRAGRERLIATALPDLRRSRIDREIAARWERLPDWVAPDPAVGRELRDRVAARVRRRSERLPGPGPHGYYDRELMHGLDHPLYAIDVEERYETERRQGVAHHDIYWDAELIEFLYRVPPHLLNRGGRSKALVRDDLARRLPGFGFEKQKKLLSRDFFVTTLLDGSEAAWRSLGGAPALAALGVVEPAGLERFVQDVFASRDPQRADDLWHILSLESWVRPRV